MDSCEQLKPRPIAADLAGWEAEHGKRAAKEGWTLGLFQGDNLYVSWRRDPAHKPGKATIQFRNSSLATFLALEAKAGNEAAQAVLALLEKHHPERFIRMQLTVAKAIARRLDAKR